MRSGPVCDCIVPCTNAIIRPGEIYKRGTIYKKKTAGYAGSRRTLSLSYRSPLAGNNLIIFPKLGR